MKYLTTIFGLYLAFLLLLPADARGPSRRRWHKHLNGRVHAVVPKHRRNIW